jgi:hypothetical protein
MAMTTERKRALLLIGVTFIVGVIIGALATGMFARQFYFGRGRSEERKMREGRHGTLTDRIFKTVEADSSQKRLMKPIIDQTMMRIDNLEEASHKDAHIQLDSLKVKLRPILSAEQMDKLEAFLSFKGKRSAETVRKGK